MVKKKSLESGEYEEIVHNLTKELFKFAKGVHPNNTDWGSGNKIKGDSNYPHQIDVSIEGEQDLILIECKCWNKNVDVPNFLTFLARFLDIKPTDQRNIHPMIVTTVGFDEGITKYLANHYGIETQVVKSAQDFAVRFGKLGAGIVGQNENVTVSEGQAFKFINKNDNIDNSSSAPNK